MTGSIKSHEYSHLHITSHQSTVREAYSHHYACGMKARINACKYHTRSVGPAHQTGLPFLSVPARPSVAPSVLQSPHTWPWLPPGMRNTRKAESVTLSMHACMQTYQWDELCFDVVHLSLDLRHNGSLVLRLVQHTLHVGQYSLELSDRRLCDNARLSG